LKEKEKKDRGKEGLAQSSLSQQHLILNYTSRMTGEKREGEEKKREKEEDFDRNS